MSNANMLAAKKAANDEFYTRLEDIENEVRHYKDHFKGKVVLCNCDDPDQSNFWKFFYAKFADYGLKRLIATHYKPSTLFEKAPAYSLVYDGGGGTPLRIG